jgi:hypothetical protein
LEELVEKKGKLLEIKKLKSISNEKKCFWLNDLAKASIISFLS